MTRGTADAVVEALARPVIRNGGNFPAPVPARRPREPEARSRALRIIQPAAHGWTCDGCTASGYGGGQLLAHRPPDRAPHLHTERPACLT